MATINCPTCGKPNLDTAEICQYCGTALKRASTVPLPPLHPGDMPTKKKTSDLESTLPGWLRDIRQGSGSENSSPEEKPAETPKPVQPARPAAPQPPKPASPKPREAASPLDFLAGLSQANEEEEETPDWLKSIQGGMPAAPAQPTKAPEPPAEEPASWLSGLQSQENEQPAASEPDWGFGDQSATFNFDQSAEQASQISSDTPDWLNALQAQADEPAQAAAFESPAPAQSTEWQAPDAEMPDWLSALSDSGISATPVQPEPEPMQPQPPQAETPDWLSALADNSSVSTPAQPEPKPAYETPDWLSALSDSGIGTTPVPPEPVAPQPAAADDTPDWLSALSADSGVAPVEQQPTQSDDTADWLSSLGASSAPQAEQPSTPSAPSADTPDWLSSLAGTDTPSADQFTAASAPNADTPDWLSSLGESSAASAQPSSAPSAQDDTPDWLASLGDSSAVASEPFSASSAPIDSGTPDWLSSLGGELSAPEPPVPSTPVQQPAVPSAQDDTPDWLASLGGSSAVTSEPFSAVSIPSQQAEDETPDWLSSLGSGPVGQIEPAPIEPSPAVPGSDADLPPWLSGLDEAQPPAQQFTPEQPAPSAVQPADSDVPPWMADLQGTPTAEAPAPVDVPDWMAGLSAGTPEPTLGDVNKADLSTESELPSWLADAMGEKPADKPDSVRKPFDTGALRDLGPLEETPDWLSTVGGPSPTPIDIPEEKPFQAPETPAKPVSPFPASSEAPTLPPNSSEEQNLDAVFSMDMPDWLSSFTPTEAEVTEAKGAERQQPIDENLSPAELPSWVQAMRPVEDVMGGKMAQAEDEDAPVESHGPLAGLRSVLPSAPVVPSVHKPKTYSIRLQVGENQQAQAALLEQILDSESTPQAVAKRPNAIVMRPLRWIIAAILFITILLGALLPDITGGSVFPSPDKSGEHTHLGAFKEIIDALPASANVLVVADYQPGFAGEMEPAAGPVFDQLMAKNARLAFVSTSPTGSYMAERLVQKFSKKYPYEPGTQYVNLGYLPGGAGGIQVFAEMPLATIGRDWFLGNLWGTEALSAVKEFSNFAAVIVMTDNPDTGRLWIEQAEPSLKSQPMLMVTSAQAEPMLRPYLASGQIKGMVSGLEDGVLYENLIESPGQARSYWDPFGVAVLAAELLIIVGGVWSLVAGYMARRANKMEQDEA